VRALFAWCKFAIAHMILYFFVILIPFTVFFNWFFMKINYYYYFSCCTASMEQATDRAETAAIDGLVSSRSENISVSFCLRAPRYGLTLWCALTLLMGGGHNTCASVTVTTTTTTTTKWRSRALQSYSEQSVNYARQHVIIVVQRQSYDHNWWPYAMKFTETMYYWLFSMTSENQILLRWPQNKPNATKLTKRRWPIRNQKLFYSCTQHTAMLMSVGKQAAVILRVRLKQRHYPRPLHNNI